MRGFLLLLCAGGLATALSGAASIAAARPAPAVPAPTRGEDHCTVDELRQERLGALGGPLRSWRIVARGFCTSPASTLNSDARILVSRFDFAGSAVFADE